MAISAPRDVIVRSLVVPAIPTIDKAIAARRVLLDWQGKGVRFNIEFCNKNQPTQADYDKWDLGDEGSAKLIDIGALKYHENYLSASDFEMWHSPTHYSRIWNRMAVLANVNNTNGFLKNLRHPVAKLMRQIPHAFEDKDEGQRQTMSNVQDLLASMFLRTTVREWNLLFSDPQYSELKSIWEGFDVGDAPPSVESDRIPTEAVSRMVGILNEKYPYASLTYEGVVALLPYFTVHGYFYRMFVGGLPVTVILKRISWWIKYGKKVQDRLAEAAQLKYDWRREFEVDSHRQDGHTFKSVFIRINNYFEGVAFSRKYIASHDAPYAVAILRSPTGGVVIQTSKWYEVDFEPLYDELFRREPGSEDPENPRMWYMERRFHNGFVTMCMNQSWQFTGVPATKLTDDKLIELVQGYVTIIRRRTREEVFGDRNRVPGSRDAA